MTELLLSILQSLSGSAVNLLYALAILIVGWLVALIIAGVARAAFKRTTIDDRIVRWIYGEAAASKIEADRWVSRGVFYLAMLFVLVAFFQQLQLTIITEPINALLNEVFVYAPRLLGAGLVLLGAFIIASILRFVVSRAMQATRIDERLTEQAGLADADRGSLNETLGNAVFWLVFLLFVPAVAGVLGLEGLLLPVQNTLNQILSVVPNLLGAGLIFAAGWLIARIVRQVVTNLSAAAGADGLSDRVGLKAALGRQPLSALLGTIAYTLILIPTLIASLDALQIAAISAPATAMLATVLAAIPAVLGAAVVLAVSFVVGRLVGQLVTNLLTGIGFNKVFVWLGLGKEPVEGQRTASQVVGYVVLVGVMLFASVEAANLLGFTIVADLAARFIAFGAQVALALVIFGLGMYGANLAHGMILSAGGRQASLGARAARIGIIVLASAMALRELGIANEIVNLAFGLVLGAIAVAVALAFGLGSREVAGRQVERWTQSLNRSNGHGARDGSGKPQVQPTLERRGSSD